MDSQAIGIAATITINSVAIAWTIRETFVRHKQTKELQESNARLQNEIHRLSVHLNQKIIRLNRLNELTRGLYISSARLSYKYYVTFYEENGKDSNGRSKNIYSANEVTDFLVTLEGSILEMEAIAKVIDDAVLLSLTQNLRNSVPTADPSGSQEVFSNKQKNSKNMRLN